MNIAVRMLRDRRRSFTGWSIGLTAVFAFSVAFYPSVKGAEAFADLFEDLPEAIKAIIGSVESIPITSPPGYLQARHFSVLAPVLMVVFAVGLAAHVMAGTEEDGTLEQLLAEPVSRARVFVERLAAMVGLIVSLGAVNAAATYAFSPTVGLLEGVSITGMAGALAAVTALALLHAAIAFAVGAMTGRRSLALTVATVVAVGGYLVNTLAAVSTAARPLRFISPWHWYLGRNMLVQGVAWEAIALPVAIGALLVAGAWRVFRARDLGS